MMGLLGFQMMFVLALLALLPAILFLLELYRALERCAPANRAMSPVSVWLLVVPVLNLVWIFFVVLNLAKSLAAEFRARGMVAEPEPGKTLGLTMAILAVCGILPGLGELASVVALVFWALYWIRIHGYSARLVAPGALLQP